MGRTILSNTISKIGKPVSKENDNRRKMAFKDISSCLERCYREFLKFHSMRSSQSEQNRSEADENSEKMVKLINELKEEINGELLRIACFGAIGQDGVEEAVRSEINEIIKQYSEDGNEYESCDLAKANVIMDFEEMNETLTSRRLDHIRRYPTMGSDEEKPKAAVPLIPRHRRSERYKGLAPWQIDVMLGRDNGFFKDADRQNGDGKIIDLNEYRQRRDGYGR